LQVSREIRRQRYTRTTRSPSWRICPGGSYQHRRALNRPTTLCTRLDDDGDVIAVAVAEPVERHSFAGGQNFVDGSGFVVLLHVPDHWTSVGTSVFTPQRLALPGSRKRTTAE